MTAAGQAAAGVGGEAVAAIEECLDRLLGRAGRRDLRAALDRIVAAESGRADVHPAEQGSTVHAL